ncbi:MAG: type VI secretion system-associated FHA domain protein TagH [Comamonadaceae bacterium]|nr:type VI secretion system-associated FHA domain protein TagH [Comamonadaceae bacterium]
MPEIVLDVELFDSVALPQQRSCIFNGLGGTIGRNEGNTLVLPDKHRRVSRLHASVTFPGGVPTITNASASLPVQVEGQMLGYGGTMQLLPGQHLEVGPYVLKVKHTDTTEVDKSVSQVELPDVQGQSSDSIHNCVIDLPKSTDAPVPFSELLVSNGPVSGDPFQLPKAAVDSGLIQPFSIIVQQKIVEYPFAGLIEEKPANVALESADQDIVTEVNAAQLPPSFEMLPNDIDVASTPARPPIDVTPKDFDPFELPSGNARNSADPLAPLVSGVSGQTPSLEVSVEPSIEALLTSRGGGSFENQSVPPIQETISGEDIEVFAEASEHSGAFQPHKPFLPSSSDIGSLSIAPQIQGPADNQDTLTLAFLKGAGLSPSALPGGLTPEVMGVIGSLLRIATGGAVDMLAARTATKLELQARVTVISSQSNNPLKFSPNAEVALQQMLGKKLPGFMRADEAMRDAFEDLRAHDIGVIAGTKSALTAVLGRFDPSVLGNRLANGSLLQNLLPALRMKKLWEIYLEQYAEIRQEAEDNFQSVFGRSFLQAYERETSRVKAQSAEFGK